MLFFFGAAFTAGYCLTNNPMSELFLQTYQMAFAGNYSEGMFFHEHDDDHPDAQGVDWVSRFSIYCVSGIVIMVALNNIFIGIISNKFDHFRERRMSLFVRHRARMALDYSLLGRYTKRNDYLWFSTEIRGDSSEKELTVDNMSIRTFMNRCVTGKM